VSDTNYYYSFLQPIANELALIGKELEMHVFQSPRATITHTRTLAESVIKQAIKRERISDIGCEDLSSRISLLKSYGVLSEESLNAVHEIRKLGNYAAHNDRMFRYSESLSSWEHLYTLMNWFVSKYYKSELDMPKYQEPLIHKGTYDPEENMLRMERLERMLEEKLALISEDSTDQPTEKLTDVESEPIHSDATKEELEPIGETVIRQIVFQDQALDIPKFLRDTFLLPQRFNKSEKFMIALGGAQQARIMSELPRNLEGLSNHVKRYDQKNEAILFEELGHFIEEERQRRKIKHERAGELFLFLRSEYIIVTDALKAIDISIENFTSMPNFIQQMNQDGLHKIGQLPQELMLLAKYERVGIGTIEKFFNQLKTIQQNIIREQV